MMTRREYIELHTIEWDFYHSACGECEYGLADNCQHYVGKCPNHDKDGD